MQFPLLNVHSYYSFLEGVASPKELAQALSQNGYTAAALTDRQRISGAVEFSLAAAEHSIRPILGLTLDIFYKEPDLSLTGDLVLLAANATGWHNICALASKQRSLPIETINNHAEGLICLTGGMEGLASRLLSAGQAEHVRAMLHALQRHFPERLYVQLDIRTGKDVEAGAALSELAAEFRLPTVAAPSIYYLHSEQAQLQQLMAAIRHNVEFGTDQLPGAHPDAHLPTLPEIEAAYIDFPEAVANTHTIAEQCTFRLPLGQPHYPALPLPPGQNADEALRLAAFAGAQTAYANVTPDINKRLEHELRLIEELGYAPIFLIMAETIRFAREADILTGSRGSAASSLVAHCLGITEPDPIALDLLFERFLNPARAKPPDIDVDIESNRRDLVIDHVAAKYGRKRVAMVATVNRFRRRSALRAAAKAYGVPEETIRAMAKKLPRRWYAGSRGDGPDEQPYEELRNEYPQYRDLFEQAAKLRGIPHHLSVHPGGVVVSPDEMHRLTATERAPKGVAITQFDLDSVEPLGLVKMDLLGIRGLAVLADVAEYVRTRNPQTYPTRSSFVESIPLEDEKTSLLVHETETIGCFQIESGGMRRTLGEIGARNINDIMLALALYRPGPLTGGLKDAFVRRHKEQEKAAYLHPSLESILQGTHGVLLYQEDVLRIAITLADFSPAEADLLRRAMSHFDPGGAMLELQEKFISNAARLRDIPVKIGGRIWDLMYAFAGYGFPKAHAASYALAAWRSAYCKAHHPAPFMAAVLANWGGYYRQKDYIQETIRTGLDVRPPHINYSMREFAVGDADHQETLFMGLDQVRDLTRRVIKRIIEERPFTSLDDLMSRVMPSKKEASHLIQVGALDGFGAIPQLLKNLDDGSWEARQPALFQYTRDGDPEADWDASRRAQAQKEILGIALEKWAA